MIVVDSSALFAMLLREDEASDCRKAIEEASDLLMSAATLTEVLVVGARKGVLAMTRDLVGTLDLKVQPLTHERALAAGDAFERWGHRQHRAGLNYGDCFAYALASELGLPLLFVGSDFSQTDIRSVL